MHLKDQTSMEIKKIKISKKDCCCFLALFIIIKYNRYNRSEILERNVHTCSENTYNVGRVLNIVQAVTISSLGTLVMNQSM